MPWTRDNATNVSPVGTVHDQKDAHITYSNLDYPAYIVDEFLSLL
jgi:hypothetical protein